MTYAVNYFPDQALLEVILADRITGADLREATTKCISLQKQTGVVRFIVDADGWEVIASFFDIYDIADKQYLNEGLDKQSRIAVILPTSLSSQAAAGFYETVCVNRGWNARVHPDRQSALEWLTDAPGSGDLDSEESVRRT